MRWERKCGVRPGERLRFCRVNAALRAVERRLQTAVGTEARPVRLSFLPRERGGPDVGCCRVNAAVRGAGRVALPAF